MSNRCGLNAVKFMQEYRVVVNDVFTENYLFSLYEALCTVKKSSYVFCVLQFSCVHGSMPVTSPLD